MSLNSAQGDNIDWAHAGAIFYFGFATVILIILIIHSFKTFQDICTKGRKSVIKRRKPPKLTPYYKFMNIGTCISIGFAALSVGSSAYSWFAFTDISCDIEKTIVLVSMQAQKTWMYLVFLTRLYTIYQRSAYAYSTKAIIICYVIIILYGILVMIIIGILTDSFVYKYGDPAYPNWCGPGEGLFIIAGSMIYIQDTTVTVAFLCAFLIPLRKILKAVGVSSETQKIVYAAQKTTILTATSTISSLVFPGITAGTGVGLFSGVDLIINPICMILMTAYYPDDLLYKRLCCMCIGCCNKCDKSNNKDSNDYDNDENNKKKRNKNDREVTVTEVTVTKTTTAQTETINTNTNSSVTSIDTMSQLRVAGDKLNPENYNQLDTVNEQNEIPEVTPEPVNNDGQTQNVKI
eukprot:14578_1